MKRGTIIITIITLFSVLVAITVALYLNLNINSSSTLQTTTTIIITLIALLFGLLQVSPQLIEKIQEVIYKRLKTTIHTIPFKSTTKLDVPIEQDISPSGLPELKLENQIKREVKSIVKEVEQAQSITANQDDLELPKEVSNDINEILHTTSVSPRAALLLLSAKIEGQMSLRLQEAGLQSATNYTLSYKVINKAMEEGIISTETVSAFRDFRAVRNKIAHDQAFDVDEATILSLVSIGIELLKVISAREREEGEINPL